MGVELLKFETELTHFVTLDHNYTLLILIHLFAGYLMQPNMDVEVGNCSMKLGFGDVISCTLFEVYADIARQYLTLTYIR